MKRMQSAGTRWRWVVLIAGVALVARLIPGPRTIDDAYITFRYARNLLAGHGLVYNPGEQVLGTTTPLYALLMAFLGVFSGGVHAPFPILAVGVNALADAATCALLIWLGYRLRHPWTGYLSALAWSIAPWSVTFAIGGLETSVYVFLLTATAAAYLAERPGLAAVCGALSLLTRPDALILLLPLGADALWRVARRNWRWSVSERRLGILAVGLLLLWGGFATGFYGSPVPHSLVAKSFAYHLAPSEAVVRLLQHYATPFLLHTRLGMLWVAVGLILYPFLFFVGVRRVLPRHAALWPWFAYPWLYFAAFAVAHPLIFRWYLTPPLAAYFFGILLGGETVFAAWRAGRRGISEDAVRLWGALATAGVFLLSCGVPLSTWVSHPDHGLNRPAPDMAWYKLELLYHRAAHLVMADAPVGSRPVLAAGDVGVLGYDTDWPILDLVGLNSPQSVPYYPLPEEMYVINYAVPPALVLDARPDYLVVLEVYGRKSLFRDARFSAAYSLLAKLDTDIYGSDGMLIFRRNVP